jgi:hypothetical protein
MEIQEAIRIGYYTKLLGNVGVPVYSEGSVPENAPKNYVIISSFTADQRFTDTRKVFECSQMVDIVTESLGPTGFGTANAIANLVEERINPDNRVDVDITDNGYEIGNTFTIDTNHQFIKDSTRYIYRVIKRYRHLVSKLDNVNT